MGTDTHMYATYEEQGYCRLQKIGQDGLTDLFQKAHTALWSGGAIKSL